MDKYYLLSKYIANGYRFSKAQVNKRIGNFNLRATQSDILLFISEHNGTTQNEIAKNLHLDKSLVGREIKYLIANKFVYRIRSEWDGRKYIIYLSPLGNKIANELKSIMNEWWQSWLNECTGVDREKIKMGLKMLYEYSKEDNK